MHNRRLVRIQDHLTPRSPHPAPPTVACTVGAGSSPVTAAEGPVLSAADWDFWETNGYVRSCFCRIAGACC